jgi:hypothetical protein
MTRQQIVDSAMSCLGVKFRHQGRLKVDRDGMKAGLDCCGFLAAISYDLDYPVVDVEGYKSQPSHELVKDILEQNFDPITVKQVGIGDIYFMRIGFAQLPTHVSILVSDETDYEHGKVPSIIHTYAIGHKGKVVIEPLEQWRPYCVSGFRWRGLEV